MRLTHCPLNALLGAFGVLWASVSWAVSIGCQSQPEGAVPTCQASGVAAWAVPELVPAGGDTGQVLAKSSDTDYEIEWITPFSVESDPIAAAALTTHAGLTEVHGISLFGASLVDDTSATAARATLGLGTAATTAATDYATAAQGGVADTALQPGAAASAIANTPAGDVAATTVQAAIDELDVEKLAPGEIKTLYGFTVVGEWQDVAAAEGWYSARFPFPDGLTVTKFVCAVNVAPTTGYIEIDLLASGVSMLSTPLTIDDGEYTSLTAAVPPVLSDTSLAYDELIRVDINAVGAVDAGKGLKCHIEGVIPQ